MAELIACCVISAVLSAIITGTWVWDKAFQAGVSWAMRHYWERDHG